MTTSFLGSVFKASSPSLVTTLGFPSTPSMAGVTGTDPVFRKIVSPVRISVPSWPVTSTSWGETRRAVPVMTETLGIFSVFIKFLPRREDVRAFFSSMACVYSLDFSSKLSNSIAFLALWTKNSVGMHPILMQVPLYISADFSIKAAFFPALPRAAASVLPLNAHMCAVQSVK